ncbi:MAG: hypothetical protein JWO93_2302 [Micrococcaceae bacterium]|jgi:hypothetical protein|nr:hypothetical protein [Micrococcaceae bacterium]
MKNRIVFVTGVAVGYVLGARAGRGSYEKLKTHANDLWNNPKVQETVSETTGALKTRLPDVQEKAAEAVKKAQETVTGLVSSKGNQAGTSTSADSGSGTGTGAAGATGPSGGNPRDVSPTPFQEQDEDTRPPLS